MFTFGDAISRIDAQPEPLWKAGMSSGQKLQRLNEVLQKCYIFGSWDGLFVDVSVTTTNGIIVLGAAYKTLEALTIPLLNAMVSIKSQLWKFSPSSPQVGDWTKYSGDWLAFDLGDDASGKRNYQVPGDPAYIDTLSFTGQAKRRYVYATNTADLVVPDCFPALLEGVRSFHSQDLGDTQRAEIEFQSALKILSEDLGDVLNDEDLGSVTLDYASGGASIANIP